MIRLRDRPATTHGAAAVPFRLIAGRIVIEAMLGGRPVAAIVDTGATMSLVRADLAAALGLDHRRQATFRSEHGPVTADLVGPAHLSIGERTLTLREAIVITGSILGETGVDVELVIGQDVLSTATIEIDFPYRCLCLRATGWCPEPGFVAVPLEIDDARRLVIPLDLPGVGRVPGIVDLGNNAALMMDAGFARRHRLTAGVATSSGLFATLGGVCETLAFSLPAFSIGGLPVLDVPVDALASWSSPQPINIGMDVLRRFHLVLDLAKAGVALRPIACVEFDREMSGVLVAHRGSHLEIMHVARGSPAESIGLQRGEHIISIDGQRVNTTYFAGDLWRWRYGPSDKQVTIETENSKSTLRLMRYY